MTRWVCGDCLFTDEGGNAHRSLNQGAFPCFNLGRECFVRRGVGNTLSGGLSGFHCAEAWSGCLKYCRNEHHYQKCTRQQVGGMIYSHNPGTDSNFSRFLSCFVCLFLFLPLLLSRICCCSGSIQVQRRPEEGKANEQQARPCRTLPRGRRPRPAPPPQPVRLRGLRRSVGCRVRRGRPDGVRSGRLRLSDLRRGQRFHRDIVQHVWKSLRWFRGGRSLRRPVRRWKRRRRRRWGARVI